MKVIAIQNYGPSGTMLLHSLLDGHPQILSMPGLYPIGLYTSLRHLAAKNLPSIGELTQFLLMRCSFLYTASEVEESWGLRQLGEAQDEHPCVDGDVFRFHLEQALTDLEAERFLDTGAWTEARRAAITSVFLAYEAALGRDMADKSVLVYPAHSSDLDDLRELAEDFPDIHFLHMVRDPVDGIFSTVKYNRKWGLQFDNLWVHDPFHCAVVQMIMDRTPMLPHKSPFHAITPVSQELEPRCRAVRLETLHQVPEQTMRAIARLVGFHFDPCMLTSTFADKKWWNRPGLRRLSGFDSAMPKVAATSALDRLRMQVITHPVRTHYGYAEAVTLPQLVAGLATLPLTFQAENLSDSLRNYAIAVTHAAKCPSRKTEVRTKLVTQLISARIKAEEEGTAAPDCLAWVRAKAKEAGLPAPGMAEWHLGILFGAAVRYLNNRRLFFTGWRALRSKSDWVALLSLDMR